MSRRAVVVIGLLFTVFMAALEATVVSTAMPTVIADLGGVEHYSWVFSAYMLASTVTVPVYGKLADLYGRKPLLLFGIFLFLIGSAASGMAGTMTQLIVFRAVQGLGAGAMQPITLTVVGDLFSVAERGRMQGLFGAVWGVAGLVGPLAGGLIVSHLSWRWVFYINLPFGVLAAGIIIGALREQVARTEHVLDVAGAVLLTLGALGLLSGNVWGVAAAVVVLAVFVRVEQRAAEPILSLRLFRERPIWVSSASNALVGAAMFGSLTFVPLYVQAVLGGTPTEAGATIAPMVVGWPIASAASSRLLTRLGFRPFIRLGLCIAAVSALALALLLGMRGRLFAQVAMFCFGVGMGFSLTALLIAVQSVVSWEQRGVVTAATMFFRTIGGTLAIGALGSYLTAYVGPNAAEINRMLAAGHGAAAAHISAAAIVPLRGALQYIFWIIAAMAVAAFGVGLRFPKISAAST